MSSYTETTSTPPAWSFLEEKYVPVDYEVCEVCHEPLRNHTEELLSIHSRKLPDSDAFRERNDSDQCPECDGTAQVTDSVINAAPEHVESCVSEGSSEHPNCDGSERIGTCYLDPDTGETVMPPDFFGEKELRWKHGESAPAVTVESCPECGTATAIKYGNGDSCSAGDSHLGNSDTFNVPFKVQEFMFESLAEEMIAELPHLIFTHHERIIEMARERFRDGYKLHGSKMYSWSPERRLYETLCEVADSVVYPTSGPLE